MPLTARQKLDNLTDALVADVMAMTDEEILAEALEEFGSVEAVEVEVADEQRRRYARVHGRGIGWV